VRRAVVYVNLDPAGYLSLPELDHVLAALRLAGCQVIATDQERLPPDQREIEMLIDGDEPDRLRESAEAACVAALAGCAVSATPRATAVCFTSSGSAEDAVGIVRAFGLESHLRDLRFDDDDTAILVVDRGALDGGNRGKLHTALEAALNREVDLIESEGPDPDDAQPSV
jgi:hypothetical protein